MRESLCVSERRACRVLGQHRSTQRHVPRGRESEDRLFADMIEMDAMDTGVSLRFYETLDGRLAIGGLSVCGGVRG